MLDEACRLVLKEVSLPGSAPGGKVEYRRTLIVSFLFKFYLEVLQSLNRMVNSCPGSIFMQSSERSCTLYLFFQFVPCTEHNFCVHKKIKNT